MQWHALPRRLHDAASRARDAAAYVRARAERLVTLPLVALLALHIWLREALWLPLTRLPHDVYLAPVQLWEALAEPRVWLTLVGCVVFAAFSRRARWADLETGNGLRIVVGATALGITWYLAFAPYNLWADELHALDRLLALGMWALLLWRPGFALLWLWSTMVLLGEKAGGVYALSWTDKRLAIDVLLLFGVWIVLQRALRLSTTSLLLSWLALTAACYVRPLLQKIKVGDGLLDWALHDDLANLFIAAYVNGWWSSFDEATVLKVAGVLSSLSAVLGVATCVVELSGALLAFHRRLAALLLLGFVGMHVGILVASGIFFWKWLIFELALAAYLWTSASGAFGRVRWWHGVMIAVIALTSPWTLKTPALGWWDTRLTQTLDLIAIGESGARYEVDRQLFAPHEIPFKQGRFFALYDVPPAVTTYGATYSRKVYRSYQDARSPKQVMKAARKHRMRKPSPGGVRRIDNHVRRVFRTVNARGQPYAWLPSPPQHIFTAPVRELPVFAAQERVVAVEWRLREIVYFDGKLHRMEDRPVHTMPIEPRREQRPQPRSLPSLGAHQRD